MPALLAVPILFALLWVFPATRQVARGMTMFLLCVSLTLVLFADSAVWALRLTLLNPKFYLDGLKDVGMFQALPAALMGMLPIEPAGEATQIESIAKEALSPDWVERELSKAVGGLLDYLNGKKSTLDIRIDLTEPKDKAQAALSAEDSSQAARLLEELDRLPDEATPETLLPGIQLDQTLAQFRARVQMFGMAGPVLLGVAGALSLVTWLVGGSSARKWLGAALVLAGVAVVVLGFVAMPGVLRFSAGINVSGQWSQVPIRGLVETSATRVLKMWQLIGGVTSALGIGLFVLRVPKKNGATPGEAAS